MGTDLWPAVHALMLWGDRHLADEDGPPMRAEHRGCGGELTSRRTCADCGAELEARDVELIPAATSAAPAPAPR
jgi:hypothetical protein